MTQVLANERVLEMRCAGRSFGAIAKAVGLQHALETHEAFRRALVRRPAAERAELRDDELRRLNELPARIDEQPGLNAEDLARRIDALRRLGALLP